MNIPTLPPPLLPPASGLACLGPWCTPGPWLQGKSPSTQKARQPASSTIFHVAPFSMRDLLDPSTIHRHPIEFPGCWLNLPLCLFTLTAILTGFVTLEQNHTSWLSLPRVPNRERGKPYSALDLTLNFLTPSHLSVFSGTWVWKGATRTHLSHQLLLKCVPCSYPYSTGARWGMLSLFPMGQGLSLHDLLSYFYQ